MIGSMHRGFGSTIIALVAFAVAVDKAPGDDKVGGLSRAGAFGAAAAPLSDEVRAAQKLERGAGVLVRAIIPGTAAEESGLQPGDVITSVDGTKLVDTSRYLAILGRRKAGETVAVTFVRDAKAQTKNITLKPRPRETGTDAYDVLYDSVASRGGRLRTIVTRPKGPGKHPALYMIQGIGGYTIESPPGYPPVYSQIIDDFARRGYVTFRVDKPGQGDSEGGPTRDVDFETELDGYRQALKALVAYDFVDRDNVIIFGHSMGGVMGPLIAAETPVKGIAVYGTVAKTWYEYLLENTRRQMALGGATAEAIDDAIRADVTINHEVFVDGKSPESVAAARPALRGRIEEMFTGGRYYVDRHFEFFRQLASKNVPAAWEKFGGHALAIWGKADFVSAEADHALIAEAVNKARPGRGVFLALEGIDHGFYRAGSQPESLANSAKPGEFNPIIVETLRDWAAKLTGKGDAPR